MKFFPCSVLALTLGVTSVSAAASPFSAPVAMDQLKSPFSLTPPSSSGPNFLRRDVEDRQLQVSIGIGAAAANFQATYLARFQHLADPLCSAPNPVIQVFCFGDLTPGTVSDASIQCSGITDGDWTGLECTNLCGTTGQPDCSTVFLENDSVAGGSFGEITFECKGAEAADVDAYMIFVGGEAGTCEAATDSSPTRNFHIAQLGVLCEDAGEGVYLFDDKDFECGLGSSGAKIEGAYTCLEGTNCEGAACEVPFNDLIIDADRQNFHECIVPLGSLPVPEEPSPEELVVPAAPGMYSATFQANWQLNLDQTVCGGDYAPKRISCPNGELTIVETLADNVNCTVIDDTTMECRDTSASNFVNEFSGVVFQCEAVDEIPEAAAEYLSANTLCNQNEMEVAVSHYIQLGVQCADSVNGEFVSNADYLFECGSEDNTFEVLDGKYTCAAQNIYGADGLAWNDVAPMPVASIRTDFRWSLGAYDICYTFEGTGPGPETEIPDDDPCADSVGLGIGFGSGADCPEDTPAPTSPPVPGATPAPTDPPIEMTVAPVETTPSPTAAPTPPATSGETLPPRPDAPAGTSYFANYRARFKRIVDDGCESPTTETALVFCEKGSIEIDEDLTSDGIFCTPPDDFLGEGEFVACQLACTGSACDDLYIDRDSVSIFGIWVINENYAEIYYTCSGDDENSVDSTYLVLGTEDTGNSGSCLADSSSAGQNLLFGELNVECPNELDGELEYVNTHAYSECGSRSIPANVNGNYTCITGDWCSGSACFVEYEDVVIEADHHRFRECIQTDPEGYLAPEPEVELDADQTELEEGQYSAQFQVGTEFWYDDDNCLPENTGVRITCEDGTIELISSESNMLCETVSDNVIECSETEFSVRNEPVDVAEYTCTSNNVVPATRVEYLSTQIGCDSSSQEQATRYINLGVYCGDPGDQSYYARDVFFECAEENEYSGTRTDDIRFSCYSRVQVPADSDNAQITIPAAEAFTDYRWTFFSNDICFTLKPPTTTSAFRMEETVKAAKSLTKAKEPSGGSASSSSGTDVDLGGSPTSTTNHFDTASSATGRASVSGLIALVAAALMSLV